MGRRIPSLPRPRLLPVPSGGALDRPQHADGHALLARFASVSLAHSPSAGPSCELGLPFFKPPRRLIDLAGSSPRAAGKRRAVPSEKEQQELSPRPAGARRRSCRPETQAFLYPPELSFPRSDSVAVPPPAISRKDDLARINAEPRPVAAPPRPEPPPLPPPPVPARLPLELSPSCLPPSRPSSLSLPPSPRPQPSHRSSSPFQRHSSLSSISLVSSSSTPSSSISPKLWRILSDRIKTDTFPDLQPSTFRMVIADLINSPHRPLTDFGISSTTLSALVELVGTRFTRRPSPIRKPELAAEHAQVVLALLGDRPGDRLPRDERWRAWARMERGRSVPALDSSSHVKLDDLLDDVDPGAYAPGLRILLSKGTTAALHRTCERFLSVASQRSPAQIVRSDLLGVYDELIGQCGRLKDTWALGRLLELLAASAEERTSITPQDIEALSLLASKIVQHASISSQRALDVAIRIVSLPTIPILSSSLARFTLVSPSAALASGLLADPRLRPRHLHLLLLRIINHFNASKASITDSRRAARDLANSCLRLDDGALNSLPVYLRDRLAIFFVENMVPMEAAEFFLKTCTGTSALPATSLKAIDRLLLGLCRVRTGPAFDLALVVFTRLPTHQRSLRLHNNLIREANRAFSLRDEADVFTSKIHRLLAEHPTHRPNVFTIEAQLYAPAQNKHDRDVFIGGEPSNEDVIAAGLRAQASVHSAFAYVLETGHLFRTWTFGMLLRSLARESSAIQALEVVDWMRLFGHEPDMRVWNWRIKISGMSRRMGGVDKLRRLLGAVWELVDNEPKFKPDRTTLLTIVHSVAPLRQIYNLADYRALFQALVVNARLPGVSSTALFPLPDTTTSVPQQGPTQILSRLFGRPAPRREAIVREQLIRVKVLPDSRFHSRRPSPAVTPRSLLSSPSDDDAHALNAPEVGEQEQLVVAVAGSPSSLEILTFSSDRDSPPSHARFVIPMYKAFLFGFRWREDRAAEAIVEGFLVQARELERRRVALGGRSEEEDDDWWEEKEPEREGWR